MSDCDCARTFLIRLGRRDEYARAKGILDAGRHPAFIGRATVDRAARDGGLLFVVCGRTDVAVAVVNAKNSTLLALNVRPDHRSHGLGSAVLAYLRPNFARVIEDKIGWFARHGYVAVGEMKQGRRFGTQVMVRSELRDLAGRVRDVIGETCRCAEHAELPTAGDRSSERHRVGEDPMPHAGHRPLTVGVADTVDECDEPEDHPTREIGRGADTKGSKKRAALRSVS